jgi:serine protease Do
MKGRDNIMENEYSNYNQNQNQNTIDGYRQNSAGGGYARPVNNTVQNPYQGNPYINAQPVKAPYGKKPSVLKKIFVGFAIGLAFGIAAGVGFFAINKMGGSVNLVNTDKAQIEDLQKQVATLQNTVSSINDGGSVVYTGPDGTTYSTVVTDVTDVVDEVMPSMVSITNLYEETYNYWGRRYVAENQASGSGIIIGEDDDELFLVTNFHVIDSNIQLTVQYVDGTESPAYVKGYDESIDIAVLSVQKSALSQDTLNTIKVAKLGDSNTLKIGEPAIAIGNALGYGQSVTTGVISALNRDIEMENTIDSLIQTNAAINPGNSGGALLNIKGEVIGINSNKLGGSAVEGMGYAIPISDVKDTIDTFVKLETKTVVSENQRGYLGINGATVDEATIATYGIPEGVYVTKVYERSAAEAATIIKGDVITKIDGQSVKELTQLQDILSHYKGGDKVKVTIMRAGTNGYTEIELDVTLGTKESFEG